MAVNQYNPRDWTSVLRPQMSRFFWNIPLEMFFEHLFKQVEVWTPSDAFLDWLCAKYNVILLHVVWVRWKHCTCLGHWASPPELPLNPDEQAHWGNISPGVASLELLIGWITQNPQWGGSLCLRVSGALSQTTSPGLLQPYFPAASHLSSTCCTMKSLGNINVIGRCLSAHNWKGLQFQTA